MNLQAIARDYLMPFITDLQIMTLETIELQASSLTRLTAATNQLTRRACVKDHRLSNFLDTTVRNN